MDEIFTVDLTCSKCDFSPTAARLAGISLHTYMN